VRPLHRWYAPRYSPSFLLVRILDHGKRCDERLCIDGDYFIGVLLSSIHTRWAWAQSSTIRADIRYTPTSAFETFPWPDSTEEQRAQISDLARRAIARRKEICA